jgi:hypothetical protein
MQVDVASLAESVLEVNPLWVKKKGIAMAVVPPPQSLFPIFRFAKMKRVVY